MEWAGLAGAAAGTSVALASGGTRTLLLYVAYEIAVVGYAVVTALQAYEACQERLGCGMLADLPSSPLDAVLRQSPALGGVLAGLLLARVLGPGARGTNPLLEAAGVHALVATTVAISGRYTDVRAAPIILVESLSTPTFGFVFAAQAIAAGMVIGLRSARPLQTSVRFVFVALAATLPVALRFGLAGGLRDPLAYALIGLVSVAIVALVALAWRRLLGAWRRGQ